MRGFDRCINSNAFILSVVKLTFSIHRIVEALISIIPVGVISPSFAANSLLPLIASLLILIKLSIIDEDDSIAELLLQSYASVRDSTVLCSVHAAMLLITQKIIF